MKPANIQYYTRGLSAYYILKGTPIIIGGCERSGTSLTQSIMSSHPHIHAIEEETWAFCYGPAAGFDSKKTIRKKRLIKALGKSPLLPTQTRWCEKSPANIFYFSEILHYFNNRVKLIYIIRDGRDVTTSIHPNDHHKTWVSPDRWIAAAKEGMKYRNHPNVITIRYEDLITDFETTIRAICEHIEEPVTNEILNWHDNATIKSSRNLIGKSIDKLSAKSIRKFESPDFKYHDAVENFMKNHDAITCLHAYGYI